MGVRIGKLNLGGDKQQLNGRELGWVCLHFYVPHCPRSGKLFLFLSILIMTCSIPVQAHRF